MGRYRYHIFVCENVREPDHPRGCCSAKGSPAIREAFKEAIAARGLRSSVRANRAGCLDACEHGVSVVVYPDDVWYGGVTLADVDEIVQSHIIEGTPVERLRIQHPLYR